MWNQIRNPPPFHRNENGQIVNTILHFAICIRLKIKQNFHIKGFFAGSHGYQFITETYIVLVLYGAVIMGVICMNEAPNIDDPNKKTSVILCGLLMVSIFFSILLYIFRSKYQGYPYRLV